ncbi:MAG TPA: formate dehydrogenase accessory sulfurtransferase FdhD [Caulobacteraceae bacterium]
MSISPRAGRAAGPPPTFDQAQRTLWSAAGPALGRRAIPQESAVALVHDASTTAVMMATPADLEDLAVGFCLSEGIVARADEIKALEVAATPLGVEARAWLATTASKALASRRRRMVGPTGCGLCGMESLAHALRPLRPVAKGLQLRRAEIHDALEELTGLQELGGLTRAVHAAGWWTPGEGVRAVREDVGRHNALDKTIGALAREGALPSAGAVLLTSRVSVEMVQKAVMAGAQAVIAVSAPTVLAVRTAAAAGMTLIAIARDDSFEVFSGGERIGP